MREPPQSLGQLARVRVQGADLRWQCAGTEDDGIRWAAASDLAPDARWRELRRAKRSDRASRRADEARIAGKAHEEWSVRRAGEMASQRRRTWRLI